ncbi:MAG: outer membrane protein assembly factor BamE [Nitrospinota bacterium]|jgi:outer membrane protein assembly factor BamE (lipoprotein component of BamABCDE complex)|nr:outer membrane protein assembly factor BamE [Nitrospinota bacterium]MDH5790330.1 outer membrane protein assembly factor BamE [Nitrospinota bacterium]
MKPLLILGTLLLCFTMTLGCGTVGKDFDIEQAQTIENGKTTREDIALMFGEPFKVGVQNSHPIWIYEKSKYKVIGDDTSKSLIVEFDDNGVVRNHSIISNEPTL